MQIQAVLSELAVEAFHESVLRRLSRLNKMQLDVAALRPEEHRLASQFGAIVA